jgi:hypothetical protein
MLLETYIRLTPMSGSVPLQYEIRLVSKSRWTKIASTAAARSKGRETRSIPTSARSCFITSAYLLKVGKWTMSMLNRVPSPSAFRPAAWSSSSALAGSCS